MRVAALAVVDWSAGASVNRLHFCERRSDVEAKMGVRTEINAIGGVTRHLLASL